MQAKQADKASMEFGFSVSATLKAERDDSRLAKHLASHSMTKS